MVKNFLSFMLTCLMATFVFADGHEEDSPAMPEGDDRLRAEYNFCILDEGKTLKDVEKYSQKYGDFAAENGIKYNQSIAIPVHTGAGMGPYTHVLIGHWPNGREMYKDWGAYLNQFGEKYPNLKAPHCCPETYATFQLKVVQAMDSSMQMDINRPVQYADCSLKEGKTMDDAIAAEKALAVLVADAGLKGYGVNYILPYLGQSRSDYDFISLSYFQSFEARGEMAYNFYKVAAKAEEITGAVYSCVNPRSFAVKSLYTNWNNN